MDHARIKKLLEEVALGKTRPDEALDKLRVLPFHDVGCAKHDSHRILRNGFAEVIYCENKKPQHVIDITKAMMDKGYNVLGTRINEDAAERLCKELSDLDYDPISRTYRIILNDIQPLPGKLSIACGGTADLPVAEEARRTVEFFGLEPRRFYDVGIAGLHRVLSNIDDLKESDAVIAVAGMEGALPSVLGGLIECPIIAVPTSVGYGTNMAGLTPLFAMLNSCSEGISVTNIDNGFGAACAAIRIIRRLYACKK
jgi:NCAIR mutase (PurE)-related protein